MRHSRLLPVVPLALSAILVKADIVYVTDLEIFTYLAPCAASAVSENIQYQTYDRCPESVTGLQGCICTQDSNFKSISSALSSSVSARCGGTASDDQASAQTVLTAYCNQDDLPTFPTPTSPVSVYITDIAEFEYLAPCAASGLSYAVQSMTAELCPPDAPLLATCACGKNQNSLLISQAINTDVKYSCSSHSEDITSAQAMFSAYCAMNDGTTSFPTPTSPPGEMSYFITALTQYSALAPCAASAVSYAVEAQTWELCPTGVEALASCVCIKESMSASVSSTLTSDVKYYCDSTASADISSALAVFDFYCSAVNGLVEAAGVTESETQTRPTGATNGYYSSAGASATRGGSSPKSSSTSGSSASTSGGSGSGGNSGGGSNDSTDDGSKSNTAVIAGAVVGVVGGIALIGTGIWFVIRHRRNNRNNIAQSVQQTQPTDPSYPGKPELGGTVLAVPPPSHSPSPSMMKQHGHPSPVPSPRPDTISPISGANSPYSPPPPHGAELHGQHPPPFPFPNTSELQGQNAYPPQPTYAGSHPSSPGHVQQYPGAQEAYGQQIYEAPGQQQRPIYQADSRPIHPPRAELQGMGWQSGPVQQEYHEMDGAGYGQAR